MSRISHQEAEIGDAAGFAALQAVFTHRPVSFAGITFTFHFQEGESIEGRIAPHTLITVSWDDEEGTSSVSDLVEDSHFLRLLTQPPDDVGFDAMPLQVFTRPEGEEVTMRLNMDDMLSSDGDASPPSSRAPRLVKVFAQVDWVKRLMLTVAAGKHPYQIHPR